MWIKRKQIVTASLALASFALSTPSAAGGAGSVALGDSDGGITDRAFVSAPPHYAYVVERDSGSFLDCGEGMDERSTDADGRDLATLRCGVTLTETLVIPAASQSARLVVHY
jgi:hypothetical protein